MAHIIAKIIVFIVNFVLWVSGILLIVFGGIGLGSPSTIISLLDLVSGVSYVANIVDVAALLEGMAIFMIVVGSLLFLFGGVGCHGIHRMHKRLLMNYWIMLILGILAEIGVIIYGAVYPGTAQDWIQTQMIDSLNSSFAPVIILSNGTLQYSSATQAQSWEYLQTQTRCCGALSYTDYSQNNILGNTSALVPPTCCQANNNQVSYGQPVINKSQFVNLTQCLSLTNYYYTQPCYQVTMNMLWNFDYIAMIIAGCLIAVQLLGSIITIHTWHRMVRENGF